MDITAMASIWTPSFSFNLFGMKITINGNVGSIGGTIDITEGHFKAGAAYGWGLD